MKLQKLYQNHSALKKKEKDYYLNDVFSFFRRTIFLTPKTPLIQDDYLFISL